MILKTYKEKGLDLTLEYFTEHISIGYISDFDCTKKISVDLDAAITGCDIPVFILRLTPDCKLLKHESEDGWYKIVPNVDIKGWKELE